MLLFKFELSGSCKRDFNTEIRFNIASARFDNADLVKIIIPSKDETRENNRLLSCVTRILGTLKKEGIIQFYITHSDLKKMTTEAQYVINKYSDQIPYIETDNVIYVKI